MWFLQFWFISTILSICLFLFTIYAILKDLKDSGFVFKEKKSSMTMMLSCLYLIVPVFNVAIAIIVFVKREYYKDLVKENFSDN